MRYPGAPNAIRVGLTVLELLVAMTIIGVLVSLLLPAVMMARESTRRTICTSHLRQVGIAIHNFHDRERRLPAAWQEAPDESQFAYGWASQLLPEIEQNGLNESLDRNLRPTGLNSLADAQRLALPLLICPSDIISPSFELTEEDHDHSLPSASILSSAPITTPSTPPSLMFLPTTSYIGVYGTVEADDFADHVGPLGSTYGDGSVINDRRVGLEDLIRGLSQTMIVGERKMSVVESTWLGVDLRGEDAGCRITGSAMVGPNCEVCDECEFSSQHSGGSNFLWADGRVTIVSNFIDSDLYRESAKRSR